jgi:1-acyl-sn-glycerol-3-phosphate acyltransferase
VARGDAPEPAAEPAAQPAAPPAAPPAGREGRLPPPRISPERLAAERGGVVEGLAWLGRAPESRASVLYRLTWLFARAMLFGVVRFRIESSGREHLPTGGYLLVGAAHRGWMDPFVVIHALPPEPRAWFLGSGPSTFTTRWREWLIRQLGGLLPVWRGGIGVEKHVESARAVVANGGVFVQMPEGTISGPPGRIGLFRPGAMLIALRTGAPIVPFAMAGTEELYVGRRMASRILPATTFAGLVPAWSGVRPEEGSREELELARRATEALAAILGPVVEQLQPLTVDPPDRPRRLRRELTWLFLRPGRLDRE